MIGGRRGRVRAVGSGARGNHPDNGWSGALEEFRLWAEPCGDSKIGICA